MIGHCQRGYNIVEMSIALVVLGLLLAGALVPLQRYYEAENNRETESLLNTAKKAVAAYAIRHRTVGREVQDHGGFDYSLPAGRPYLPCPDIDNDGVEDRTRVTSVTVQSAKLISEGVCAEQKGALPWKTLGLPDTDSWGNRLTYLVDEAFSNSIIGFDGKTRADIFDPRKPLDYTSGTGRYQLRAHQDNDGAIICSLSGINSPAGDCRFSYNLQAGIIIPVTLTVGARVFNNPLRGVAEGLPFVIVSHGRNGFGAINRKGRCRDLSAGDEEEQENAYLDATHYLVTLSSASCSGNNVSGGALSHFVNRSHGKGAESFDDLIAWMSSDQLMSILLYGGVLPIPSLDFLPE